MSDDNIKKHVEKKYKRADRTIDTEHGDVGQMTLLFCAEDAATFYTVSDF